jgi:hypothetical protein
VNIGKAAFEAQLIGDGLSFRDLEAAKQHAVGEQMEVADALVALSLVAEADSYASLAKATGLLLVDLEQVEICSYCKRVRNDGNDWEQLESYISEHTDAQFSHGICPPRLATAYAE